MQSLKDEMTPRSGIETSSEKYEILAPGVLVKVPCYHVGRLMLRCSRFVGEMKDL